MNLEMMGGILEYNEGAHIWSSSDQQNGDVLGEALNNFQTMTLHHLIQRLCPGKISKV